MAAKILEEQCDAINSLMYASEQQVVNRRQMAFHIAESCHASISSLVKLVNQGAQAHEGKRRTLGLIKNTFGLLTGGDITLRVWPEASLSILNADNAAHLSAASDSLHKKGKLLVAVTI